VLSAAINESMTGETIITSPSTRGPAVRDGDRVQRVVGAGLLVDVDKQYWLIGRKFSRFRT
jgi:hypothetical protein